MRSIMALAMVAVLTSPVSAYSHHGAFYRSSDGSTVHVPYRTSQHVSHELAVCRDGSHSVSHHHRGTCSHHGGVAHWD